MGSLSEKISNLEDLISKMEYVEEGDYVFAKHINNLNEASKIVLDFCKEAYDKYKEKTGETLDDVELWLYLAENRINMMRSVKYGDIVLTKDHNLIIDSLKPLELVLRRLEQKL
ncbi:MAG: hypothetical protein DRP01_01595 [Archaeoglobales archaeon]|nr:MAG: hypothetical protein DRP01_01595 [Archaeoglobales archaeon]